MRKTNKKFIRLRRNRCHDYGLIIINRNPYDQVATDEMNRAIERYVEDDGLHKVLVLHSPNVEVYVPKCYSKVSRITKNR